MAQINFDKLKKIEKQRNTIQEKVIGAYTVFEKEGEKYFQIDTYGKEGREMPEKVSQSLQLDRKSAIHLVNLLSQEFDL